VSKWTLSDGVQTMTFKFNPYTMSSPYTPKSITIDTIQQMTVMNPAPGSEWNFQGYIYSQVEYDKFVYWYNKDTLLTLTDHLGREWEVVSSKLDITDRRNTARNSNRYEYTWNVINIGRSD
jgi:hypothetical protein